MLHSGENMVLDDGYVGYRQKLALTNERLIYSKKEGWFNAAWVKVSEILLEDIEEAYVDTTGGLSQMSSVKLRMKDGSVRDLNVSFGGGDAVGNFLSFDMATDLAVRTKTVSDKWVNAINQQLRLKGESQTEMLEERIRELEEKLKEKEKKGNE